MKYRYLAAKSRSSECVNEIEDCIRKLDTEPTVTGLVQAVRSGKPRTPAS